MHYFYVLDISQPQITLSTEESEHCIRVMRHREGDIVRVTDGRGHLADFSVIEANPKKCILEIHKLIEENLPLRHRLHLAIAPTKNIDRMEWLVEKAVEIGVHHISFLLCDHSERSRVNMERMNRLAISALKQSQTSWLPIMQVLSFDEWLDNTSNMTADRFMAWCDDDNNRQLATEPFLHQDILLLIGPEGDFSPEEVAKARQLGYVEVKLGNRRLRTETAGLYGCLTVAMREITSPIPSTQE